MRSNFIILIGVVLTAAFTWYCYDLSQQDVCFWEKNALRCMTNYDKFIESTPNEKGDTLAGLAGSLAFLWIIVTVLLQGKELSLQREELEKMRTAQQEQTAFMRLEETRKTALQVDAKIRAMVKILQGTLPRLAFQKFLVSHGTETNSPTTRVVFHAGHPTKAPDGEQGFEFWASQIEIVHKAVRRQLKERDGRVVDTPCPVSWFDCLSQIPPILEATDSASPAVAEWIHHGIKLPYLKRVLQEAIDDKTLWSSIQPENEIQ